MSSGTFLLVTLFWPSLKWFPLLLQLRVVDILRLPLHDDLLVDLTTGLPPLVDLRLVVWKICGGFDATESPTPPFASSLLAGAPLPLAGTSASGTPSETFCVPEHFRSLASL